MVNLLSSVHVIAVFLQISKVGEARKCGTWEQTRELKGTKGIISGNDTACDKGTFILTDFSTKAQVASIRFSCERRYLWTRFSELFFPAGQGCGGKFPLGGCFNYLKFGTLAACNSVLKHSICMSSDNRRNSPIQIIDDELKITFDRSDRRRRFNIEYKLMECEVINGPAGVRSVIPVSEFNPAKINPTYSSHIDQKLRPTTVRQQTQPHEETGGVPLIFQASIPPVVIFLALAIFLGFLCARKRAKREQSDLQTENTVNTVMTNAETSINSACEGSYENLDAAGTQHKSTSNENGCITPESMPKRTEAGRFEHFPAMCGTQMSVLAYENFNSEDIANKAPPKEDNYIDPESLPPSGRGETNSTSTVQSEYMNSRGLNSKCRLQFAENESMYECKTSKSNDRYMTPIKRQFADSESGYQVPINHDDDDIDYLDLDVKRKV